MKTKNEKKFGLEKFAIAKLTNPKSIIGGDTGSSDVCTTTDTGNDSTRLCLNDPPPKTDKDKDKGPQSININ